MPKIAVIPGDGIGIDVTREAVKVLKTMSDLFNLNLELNHFDYGAERYLKDGTTLPESGFIELRDNYDAIFLGALGDPRVPDMSHAKDILLGLRFRLDLYVNHRPIKLIHEKLCPLKDKGPKDVNFVVFRENTEGFYVGSGGNFKKDSADEIAIQESINTRKGVERIIEFAFNYAEDNGLKSLTMADKSNALQFEGGLWQRTFEVVRKRHTTVEANHLYIDALTMQMVKKPEQFEVIVTNNMFGDIITDLGAQLQGGLGLGASGNINPETKKGLFEPIHGSAPKYHGKNIANPMGAILSAQMLLEFLGLEAQASIITDAITDAIEHDWTARDLGGSLGTVEVGDHIVRYIEENSGSVDNPA
ncbi:MAG: 3-isopropylmalate dehydrogenase [Candidatus Marinimicrobia bacterium]|nr:3-isopropylmalate dehydrogenase [Candidatus Neomarinimicrobiota bacterium]